MSVQNLSGRQLGKYQLKELLGVGGMGAVYQAYQADLKRYVAVKVLPPAFAQEQGYAERFDREAQTAARLEHSHIVPVYDYGVQDGITYVVMRLLNGGSLVDRLQERQKTNSQLPSLREIADILNQLASALDYAHSEGVVHRDIKASNVMFDNQGNAFIVDFGIAKLVNTTNALTSLTTAGAAMGTPSYMAPEQWRGEEITGAADQYALGVMTYAMVTGRMPFEAETPYAYMHKHANEMPTPPDMLRAGLPANLKLVLARALAKEPGERFPTVVAFAQAFERLVPEGDHQMTGFKERPATIIQRITPSGGEIPPSGQRTVPSGKRKLPLVWVIGLLVVILLVGIGLILGSGGGNAATEAATVVAAAVESRATPTTTATDIPTATITATPTVTASLTATATSTNIPTPIPTTDPQVIAQMTYEFAQTVSALVTAQRETDVAATAFAGATLTVQYETEMALTAAAGAMLTAQHQANMTATAMLWTDTPTPTVTATATTTPTATVTPSFTPTGTPSPTATEASLDLSTTTIVFTCFINSIDQLCSIDGNGGNERQLTRAAATTWYASISRDGQQILYSSRQTGRFEIYTMNKDGSSAQQITVGADGYAPALSPDGSRIVFAAQQSNPDQDIFIMNADGSNMRQLTTGGGHDVDPVWSPDGSQILFASDRNGTRQLFIMNPDGTNVRQITTDGVRGRSDWSLDGRYITFYAGEQGDEQIYIINTDGTNLRQLTQDHSNKAPSFSPDGLWIVYASNRDGDNEIMIMRIDGSAKTQLTFNARADYQPRWGR